MIPDAFILVDYALDRMNGVLKGLEVDQGRVKANLEKAGSVVYSGHLLLELVRVGASREQAYRWVQECALGSLDSLSDPGSASGRLGFQERAKSHPEIRTRLSPKKLVELGSSQYQLRHVEEIFRRARKMSGARK
jgi:adenylosuccinate lyase